MIKERLLRNDHPRFGQNKTCPENVINGIIDTHHHHHAPSSQLSNLFDWEAKQAT